GTEQLAGIPTPDVSLSAGRRNRAPPLTTISKANGIQNATAVKDCRFDPARSRVPAPNCVEGSSRRRRLSFASLSFPRRRTPCLSRQSYDPIEHHLRNQKRSNLYQNHPMEKLYERRENIHSWCCCPRDVHFGREGG